MGKKRHKKNGQEALADCDEFVTIPSFNAVSGVRHAFTTRWEGQGGRRNGERLPEDWSALALAFGIPYERIATVNQVHGENIVRVDDLNIHELRQVRADAVITDAREIAVGVETADCVPVLLYDPVRPAIAAVHAGWRSTVKKIVQKAVHRMYEEFRSEPAKLIAGIGPAICSGCYEVDEPVMGPVRESFAFWKDVVNPRSNGRWSLDLVKANKLELIQIGLDERNVHTLGHCTSCRKDLFYSYRAEGKTGRMLSAIMIMPE